MVQDAVPLGRICIRLLHMGYLLIPSATNESLILAHHAFYVFNLGLLSNLGYIELYQFVGGTWMLILSYLILLIYQINVHKLQH